MYQHFRDMIFRRIKLPSETSKSRVIGKAGAKIQEIGRIAEACVEVQDLEVLIWAPSEEGAELAKRLVLKCIEHGQAANRAVAKESDVSNAVKSDLMMAAYFTYCD